MPMHLQPKIKKHQECGECGTSNDGLQLIEICTPKCKDSEAVVNEMPVKKDLCTSCAVGHDVPVFRYSEEWEFGEITRYDSSKHIRPFLVSFLDGSREWVDVSRKPFLDYLDFIRRTGQTQQVAVAIEHLDWLDKFGFSRASTSPQMPDSLSTLSTPSSIGAFEPAASSIFPLFNDDKLFDVEDLVFVDDDIDMEDFSSEVSAITESEDIKTKPSKKRKAPTTKAKAATKSPKHWSTQEDQLLIKIMDSFHKKGIKPKWPEVAAQILTRSGKQCRERYVNHLSSSLKPKIWHPSEDVLIMQLFFKHGRKWSQIAKGFVGRTDNGIKNRFHHLRRWLEKDYRNKCDPDDESMSSGEDMVASMREKVKRMISDIATESKGGVPKGKYNFGKLKKVKRATSCKRCCLFVPSAHTGDKICSVTGFCEACVSIPTYVVGDDLRACLSQRIALDDFMLE